MPVGEAGHWGKDIRSDAHVWIEPRDRGGIDIVLESRVKPYYGDSILAQTRRALEGLGVKHAQAVIHDEGALPFVLSARIETAAKRAGASGEQRVLPDAASLPGGTARDRIRRSRLYVPGNEPKYFINAALYGPDGVILDLEDSVHAAEKDAARILVRNALRAISFGTCERMVRINQLPLGLDDLEAIVPEFPDLILIPKVERPEQVMEVGQRVEQIKGRHNLARDIWLMPILESALGIENAYKIANAGAQIAALTIGLEDYTADLGVVKTNYGTESFFARERIVNAARAAGIQAIDSVFSDVGDMEGLKQWGMGARALGFEGMGCIHPLQIRVVHEAFSPTQQEIDKALKIVAAFNEAQQKGLAVVSVGAKMVDPPVVQRALKLVARAQATGLAAKAATGEKP
jgi:citrate lyase subunit beta / citryl-CoA lyase